MNVLITGIDGSLGSVLASVYEARGFKTFGITNSIIQGTNPDTIHDVIYEQVRSHPCPDIIINNYGENSLNRIGQYPHEHNMYQLMNLNVNSMYAVVNSAKLIWGRKAKVLNIASIAHRTPMRCTALYCASKAAVVQLTRVMARELAPDGWVINCLAPGRIDDTRMTELTNKAITKLRNWTPEYADAHALANIPMGRFTSTNEVAQAVTQILELPSYINGTCIDMAGGA